MDCHGLFDHQRCIFHEVRFTRIDTFRDKMIGLATAYFLWTSKTLLSIVLQRYIFSLQQIKLHRATRPRVSNQKSYFPPVSSPGLSCAVFRLPTAVVTVALYDFVRVLHKILSFLLATVW